MERKSLDFLTNEKVDFYSSFDEIAHKISQILPFSKLLLISTDNDFFDFASQLFNKLSSLGLKVVNIIYNQNVSGQIEDLIEDYPFEDHRGIITFSKTVLFKLNQNCVKVEKIFFVQKQLDTYGIFFNFNGIKNKNIHYILCDRLFDEQYAKKSFAIKTVHLIDYVFRNQLLNQRADTIFFLSQKKKLVNALMALKSFCLNKQMLFRLNLELENSICKSIYPFGAINVCTFLFCKDFFEFKSAFHFSNALIQKLKGVLSGKIVEEKIDYSERAKIIHFLTNQDILKTIEDMKNQANSIGDINFNNIKQEIKKLVMLYQDFCLGIDENNINNYNVKQEELAKTCLTLSGDTGFSINTCTALREMIG